jgi:hypothetical protein
MRSALRTVANTAKEPSQAARFGRKARVVCGEYPPFGSVIIGKRAAGDRKQKRQWE